MSTHRAKQMEQKGRVSCKRTSDGIAVLRLGENAENLVILTRERINSLKDELCELKKNPPSGLVIIGPNEDMFTVGADINEIKDVTESSVGEKLSEEGQEIFDLIGSLPCTTVAAISGPCLGGGCEMALACDYRIITDSSKTAIGLPEVKLGIIPGFGGTQRLPRLIGIASALDIILSGKILKPAHAKKIGLVDKIVKYENLEQTALDSASGSLRIPKQKPGLVAGLLTFTSLGRRLVRSKTVKALKKKTKGFYPAPSAALESVLKGLSAGMKAGLKFEAKELGRLIVTQESKALVHLYFLTEASKSLGKKAAKGLRSPYALVIGSGTMGAGIAGLLSRHECSVILRDRTEADLERGLSQIKKDLSRSRSLSEADRSFILNRIETTTKDSPNMATANVAIEAVFEEMEIKKKVLQEAARHMASDSIIATNTSSLSVTEIASAIENPERVVGIHFFNPVAKMPLIEIVRGRKTSDKTIALSCALAVKLGKFPVVAGDVPGFLVNRILSPYLNESGYLLADGYSIKDIDSAALRFGMPMGPVRLLDEVGLDVASHVAESMYKGYGERMKSLPFAKILAAKGRKGKKSGAGFYDFSRDTAEPHPEIAALLGIKTSQKTGSDLKEIEERLIMGLINEAVRSLDEGVAGTPGPEAAGQIDLGSVMGFGFPPFRGGVLYYAESLGVKNVFKTLSRLEKECGKRFSPCRGIKERARTGRSFIV